MAIVAIANGNVSSQNDINQYKSWLVDGTMTDQAINLVYTGASNALKISSDTTYRALTVTNQGIAKDIFNVDPTNLIVSVPNGGKFDCYSDAYTTVTAQIDAATGRMNLATVLSALGVYDQTQQWRIEVGSNSPGSNSVGANPGTWSPTSSINFAHAFTTAPIVLVTLDSGSSPFAAFNVSAYGVSSSSWSYVLENITTSSQSTASYLVNYLAFGY